MVSGQLEKSGLSTQTSAHRQGESKRAYVNTTTRASPLLSFDFLLSLSRLLSFEARQSLNVLPECNNNPLLEVVVTVRARSEVCQPKSESFEKKKARDLPQLSHEGAHSGT